MSIAIYNSRNLLSLLDALVQLRQLIIYNSRNLLSLLDYDNGEQYCEIYNSRNLLSLLDVKKLCQAHLKSTIVEIY